MNKSVFLIFFSAFINTQFIVGIFLKFFTVDTIADVPYTEHCLYLKTRAYKPPSGHWPAATASQLTQGQFH